jgi:hypothetical protein
MSSGMSGGGTGTSPRGTVRTVRITRGNGLRLGDSLVTKWARPQADPPKDFAVADVQKQGPVNPSAPPLQLEPTSFLQSVCTACDPAISQCSPTFRRYFKQHFLSEGVQGIMVDAFWYCFVELFESDEDQRCSHNQVLHDRLGRSFATFCWGITPSKNKDFFLQYFPYCLVAALSQAFKATFPGSAKQFEPEEEFADYINAIISELFVHDSGSPHGKNLRTLMRENLFKKADGPSGSHRRQRSLRRRKTHRWIDIERPGTGTDGKYTITATRPTPDLPNAKPPQAEFDEVFEQQVYSDQSFKDVGVPQRPMTGTCNVDEWSSQTSPLIDYFLQATSPVPYDQQAHLNATMQRSLDRAKALPPDRSRTSYRDEIRGAKADGGYSKQAREAVLQAREAKRNYAKKKAEIQIELEESRVMLQKERRKIRTARRSVLMDGRRALKSFSNDIIAIQERSRSGVEKGGLPEKQEELPGGVVLESIGGDFDFELDPGEEHLATTPNRQPKPQWLVNLHKQKLRA